MDTQSSRKHVQWTTPETAPAVQGRREFFTYRSLQVDGASDGAMRAHITASVKRMTGPTGWHYHICESQFGYVLQGWIDLIFEDRRTVRLEAGDSIYIPGGVRHNETAVSDDFEILEVCVPASFGTEACEAPDWEKEAQPEDAA